jgi:hypothetical protein
MVKTKTIGFLTLLCALIPVSSRADAQSQYEHIRVIQTASFGFEKSNVKIELVRTKSVDPDEAGHRLRVTDGSEVVLITGIGQLRGHVQIRSEQAALRFVRLQTSPETWYLFRGREVEIIESNMLHEILTPGFGARRVLVNLSGQIDKTLLRKPGKGEESPYWLYEPETKSFEQIRHTKQDRYVAIKTDKRPDLSAYGDGSMGVLSSEAFKKGGFSSPEVLKAAGGYQITRWIYADGRFEKGRGERVQKIREVVGEDGAYTRAVLETKKPPRLPGIQWLILTFE